MGSAGNYGEIPDEFSHSYRHAVYPQLYSASFADDAFIHEIQTTFDTELDRIKSLETTHPEVSDLLRSYLSELATLRRRYESEYDDHRRRQAWPLFGHGVDHGDSTQSNLDVDAMRARIAALCSKYIGLLESKFNTSLTGPSRDPQEKTP